MLRREHLKHTFASIYLAAHLCIFPVKFDRVTGKMIVESLPRWRIFVFKLWTFLSPLNAIFIVYQTIKATITGRNSEVESERESWNFFPLLLIWALCYISISVGNHLVFNGDRKNLTAKLFNEFLDFLNKPRLDSKMTKKKKQRRGLDQLIRMGPFLLYPFYLVYPFMYLYKPSIPILYISVWDLLRENPYAYTISLIVQILFQIHLLTNLNFFILFMLYFISTFIEDAEGLSRRLKWFAHSLRVLKGTSSKLLRFHKNSFNKLHELKLRLLLFNLTFSKIVFLSKLLCLNGAIWGGFAAIRQIQEHPILALNYALNCSNVILFFVGMYQQAFKITALMDTLKRTVFLLSPVLRLPADRRECQMVARAIPLMGIRVSGFSIVERISVPLFVSFVFQQITNLLITF